VQKDLDLVRSNLGKNLESFNNVFGTIQNADAIEAATGNGRRRMSLKKTRRVL
jgi:hypothetical protein